MSQQTRPMAEEGQLQRRVRCAMSTFKVFPWSVLTRLPAVLPICTSTSYGFSSSAVMLMIAQQYSHGNTRTPSLMALFSAQIPKLRLVVVVDSVLDDGGCCDHIQTNRQCFITLPVGLEFSPSSFITWNASRPRIHGRERSDLLPCHFCCRKPHYLSFCFLRLRSRCLQRSKPHCFRRHYYCHAHRRY